jgi:acid phosphatase (class A)
MKQKSLAITLTLFSAAVCLSAQAQSQEPPRDAISHSAHKLYFVDPAVLDLALLLPPPPARDSEITKNELSVLHAIQQLRTSQQVVRAQADDQEQDIFLFKTIFGQTFNATNLPLTAALSNHIYNDEDAASKPLKSGFSRPRPFQVDDTLHPVCTLSQKPNSYPSGHTLGGYLFALTLVQMVPEKKEEILQRADEYAHNRMVCGVHYASDLEASQKIAYATFGYMLADPGFQKELAAARRETRAHLRLPALPH